MKYTLFIILSVLFVLSDVHGQAAGTVLTTPFAERGGGVLGNNAKALALLHELRNNQGQGESIELSDIKGSMYFEERYLPGSIYVGTQLYGNFPMRYNGFTDEIEVEKAQGMETESVFKTNSLYCNIGMDTYVLKDYLNSKDVLVQGYLLRLTTEGKYRLFQKRKKVFKEGKKAQTSLHKDAPHKFKTSESFYVQVGDKYPRYLKNSKKALKEIFDESDLESVKKYIKENSIKLNDKESLIRLFNNVEFGT